MTLYWIAGKKWMGDGDWNFQERFPEETGQRRCHNVKDRGTCKLGWEHPHLQRQRNWGKTFPFPLPNPLPWVNFPAAQGHVRVRGQPFHLGWCRGPRSYGNISQRHSKHSTAWRDKEGLPCQTSWLCYLALWALSKWLILAEIISLTWKMRTMAAPTSQGNWQD